MRIHFHPVPLAAYPTLHLYSTNPALVDPDHLTFPLLLYLGASLTAWLGFSAILKSATRSAVLVSLWLIAFSSYGHLYGLVDLHFSSWVRESGLGINTGQMLHWIMGGIWVCLFLAAPLLCERLTRERVDLMSTALGWFSIVLLAFPVFAIGKQWIEAGGTSLSQEFAVESQSVPGKESDFPDVYLIILDGYARRDILQRYYGHDNQDFIASLEDRGFRVANNARSNYTWSLLSIPSMLNLEYLDDLMEFPTGDNPNISGLVQLFRANRVSKVLRNKGLAHFHLQSTYAATMRSPYADREFGCSGRFSVDFHRLVAEASFLRIWSTRIINNLAECHLEQFERLEAISSQKMPKFVFAHFILPHPPYVFDRLGNIRDQVEFSDQFHVHGHGWSLRDEYLDQLIFVNYRISQTIDAIIEQSGRDAVIALVSDHGPKLMDQRGRPDPDYANARFANLIAVLSPDKEFQLPDDISLVNLFRLVLDHHFDEELELLENRHFQAPTGNPFVQEQVFFQGSARQ